MKNRYDVSGLRTAYKILGGVFILWAAPLFGQTVINVTTNAGDQSVGSLGSAVTYLNATGNGQITFNISVNPAITLSGPLSALSNSVTFQGQDLNLAGRNNSESQLFFQNAFTQENNIILQNNGSLGAGLNASVTALSWSMISSVYADISAGAATNISTTSGIGVTGEDGGNVSANASTWIVGQGAALDAGNGGSITDVNGSGDVGGQGGAVSISGVSLVMPGTFFQLSAGAGGSVTDSNSGSANTGGKGGSASVSYSSIVSGPFGNFTVTGGNGGSAVTGGDGGGATVIAGLVSLTQGFSVQGGNGGAGSSASGSGGNAYVSIGTYSGTSSSNIKVAGGTGGTSSSVAGDGGNAFYAGASATVNGPAANFQVLGGNGGNLGPNDILGNGGNGGTAGVSLANLSIISTSTFKVDGGNGGLGTSAITTGNGGNGGTGGNTAFSIGATFSVGNSAVLNLSSGYGGQGGSGFGTGNGGDGGAGGNLAVTLGTLNLGTNSILNLSGGVGGAGGTASSGTGGDGGDGGNVTLSIAAVSMSSGNILNISGGGGGSGGLAGTSGTSGATGQASATFGDLEGSGSVNMGGQAVLSVAQGNYSGTLTGSEILDKTTSSALTLSGFNTYSGGTSVLAGTLFVDMGGALGGGTAYLTGGDIHYLNNSSGANTSFNVGAGRQLLFQNTSTASSALIDVTGNLTFSQSSSAGSASVTIENGGLAAFTGSAQGGTSSFSLLNGSKLDIGGSASGVTVGSLAGSGSVTLGGVDLGEGTNNSSTTFSGVISDNGISGSLTKLGMGTFTLANNNSYIGGTTIAGGTLAVGSQFALGTGSVAVNSGTLSTAGTPLIFQVGGNYSQSSTGILQLGLGGASASSIDKLNILGSTVNLGGTLDLTAYAGLTAPVIGTTVLIFSAPSAAINGIFQQVNENFSGMRFLPVYLPTAVELLSIVPSFQNVGLTPNQKAIGADLDAIYLKPQLNALVSAIGVMSNNALQVTYNQLSPEDLTGLYQAEFEGAMSRAALVNQRLDQLRNNVDRTVWLPGFSDSGRNYFAGNLPASHEKRMAIHNEDPWSGFVSGMGGLYNVTSDGNAAGYKTTAYGLTAAGVDYRLSRQAAIGLMVGYGHSDIGLGTSGTLTADGGQVGLYGLLYSDGFYADGLVEGGISSFASQRLGYFGIAQGNTPGQEMSGALQLGYAFKQDKVSVGPVASMQYTHVSFNGFTEQGSGAPLSIPAQSADSMVGQIGLQAGTDWKMGTAVLDPSIRVSYEHEFNYQGGTFQAGFGTGDQFTVSGPAIGQDGLLVGAAVDLVLDKTLSFSVNYQGELNRTDLNSNQFGGGMEIGF